jgi:hypothetical protein
MYVVDDGEKNIIFQPTMRALTKDGRIFTAFQERGGKWTEWREVE